jgi:hypothetical protein
VSLLVRTTCSWAADLEKVATVRPCPAGGDVALLGLTRAVGVDTIAHVGRCFVLVVPATRRIRLLRVGDLQCVAKVIGKRESKRKSHRCQ